jgi:hypothetical protein
VVAKTKLTIRPYALPKYHPLTFTRQGIDQCLNLMFSSELSYLENLSLHSVFFTLLEPKKIKKKI